MTDEEIRSEVTGSVWKIQVKEGDTVDEEDELLILESMKMEIPVEAPVDGVVKKILVQEGEQIATDQVLVIIESN
ncbi:MAG: acetyl-CoA carboxylase biotin carboxyl carrier protein subunit [Deltaproteobacteria bacterium]|nr:acetyl-CoA carboxylase biotin carboxyl carrier protein subunit [Deltaproteobacteria bacterium]